MTLEFICNDSRIAAFKQSLALVDWSTVTDVCLNSHANIAYDSFFSFYKEICDQSLRT